MKLIVASDPKGGIGYQNRLPWDKIQGDLARFKRLTSNGTIVMGHNTWESLPKKPLPDRTNIVVSSKQLVLPGGVISTSDVRQYAGKDFWIIGGARLIDTSWEYIDEVHLTRTFTEYTCDTFIDLVRLEKTFVCRSKEEFPDHTYEIWNRN